MANVIEFSVRAIDEFSSTMKAITGSMDNAAARITIAGTAATAAAVAFHKFVDGTLAQAEAAQKAATKVDMTVEAYMRLANAARLANVDEGALTSGMRRLAMTLNEAQDPTSKQAKLLAELGINAKTPQQAMMQFADILQHATGTTGKLAIGQELLGRGFQELLPLLKQGSGAIKEQGDQAERLGLIFDSSLAASADNARDNAESLLKSLEAIKNQAIMPLAPALEATSGKWVKFMESSQGAQAAMMVLRSTLTVAMKLLAAFGDIALSVAELFGSSFKIIGSMLGGIGAALVSLMKGDFEQARNIMSMTLDDATNSVAKSKDAQAAIWEAANNAISESEKKVGVDLDETSKKVKAKEDAEKAAAEAAKQHAARMKELQAAADGQVKTLGALMVSLKTHAEQVGITDEHEKRWLETQAKLKANNATPEVIAMARAFHDQGVEAEFAKNATKAELDELERKAAATQANLGPMQQLEQAQRAINSAVAEGTMTQSVANQKLWEADLAMKQSQASIASLTASQATAAESFQMMAIAQLESLGSVSAQVGQMMLSAMNTFVSGMANAVATAIVMGTSLSDLMKRVLQQVAIQVISTLIQIGIQRFILAGIYQAMNIKDAASSMSTGLAKVYVNSFASAASIPIVGWAIAPGVAAANTAIAMGGAAAAGATGVGMGMGIGAAHGGLGYVPEESTYLLQQGERVLSPRQNRDLTGFMESGGGGGGSIGTVNIHILENATNAEVFAKMNRVELRAALGQPVVDALNEMFRVGVKPDFASVAG